jgi:HAE1 family hydrophobic/amphiphilic exporter-1
MNLAALSIKRPTFITCIIIAMLIVGYLAFKRLGVDLFPNITFPVVTVYTTYPGAGPKEIEILVSKVIEEQVSSTPGVKWVRSISREGLSIVIAEFSLETDVKYAEQQVKDKVALAKRKLPDGIQDSIIRRIEPSEQPVVTLAVEADLPPTKLYELADLTIRPRFEQIPQVGLVDVIGGRKREIHVVLDRDKMKDRELSVNLVAQRLGASGMNIPAGKVTESSIGRLVNTQHSMRSVTLWSTSWETKCQ